MPEPTNTTIAVLWHSHTFLTCMFFMYFSSWKNHRILVNATIFKSFCFTENDICSIQKKTYMEIWLSNDSSTGYNATSNIYHTRHDRRHVLVSLLHSSARIFWDYWVMVLSRVGHYLYLPRTPQYLHIVYSWMNMEKSDLIIVNNRWIGYMTLTDLHKLTTHQF